VVIKKSIYILSALLLLLSCGKGANDKDDGANQEVLVEGTYSAILIPVNEKVTYQINGEVQVSRYGDQFSVNVRLKDAPAGLHKQQLHSGNTCPNKNHDVNGDGYIDMSESRQYLGDTLIPFDDDLSGIHLGSGFTPSGSYRYSRSTSYYLMLSDLDINEEDFFLENKVVSIFGKSSIGEVPIACGFLKKISDTPTSGQWEEETPSPRRPGPRPGPSRPRPSPEPEDPPEPSPPANTSWWERMRQRWQNWRERTRDWWNGAGQPANIQALKR